MNRVAVITGGSRGIGRAVAFALAKRGYKVCIGYRSNQKAADDAVTGIEVAGGTAAAVRCDLGIESEIMSLFAKADSLGPLGVLVNNAGIVAPSIRLDEMSTERFQRMMSVNVVGSLICAREAVRRMSTRHGAKGGVIVNLSSMAATLGAPNTYIDYAASKGAIDTMTIGLAREVANEGIRVNAIRPGLIDTDIHASGGDAARLERLRPTVPMQRIGTATEVANAVVWLISDEASYVTGTIFDVSGGR
jgi:NAD(P)-dependent dehydrogenase (short-subunit alcohol dehydrogenase family)